MSARNFLILMADQLTPFALGCYGNRQVKSPHIDRLAENGVVFDAAYCNSPLCTPGRYAFMTGRYVSRYGGYDNAAYLPSNLPTFAHYLRAMGYRTCLSGKMHFVGADQLHGFEERLTTDIYPADFGWVPDWTKPDERIDLWYHNMSSVKQAGVAEITNQLAYDDEVGAQAQRAIYDYSRSTDERPFCLVASFIHPHDPYATRQRHWSHYEDVEIDLPTVPRPAAAENDPHSLRLEKAIAVDAVEVSDDEIRNARRAYYGNVSYVDEWVGRLMATLEDCGLREDTTVIFISDHGDMLGERGLWYKMSFYEWSVRVPLIISAPQRFQPRRAPQAVSQVDILPTLLDLAALDGGANIPTPVDPLDGRSLVPLCQGNAAGDVDLTASEYMAEATGAPILMLRQGALKYTCCPGDPEQLFDLAADPNELANLAPDPAHAATLEAFRARAADHWDPEEQRQRVIADQARRRFLGESLRQGKYTSWDYQPGRDASNEYTRSHMELTAFDYESRFPRPRPFNPRWN
ncbi:MAG: choline-sulfatase [Pseudomonadota bacterium]